MEECIPSPCDRECRIDDIALRDALNKFSGTLNTQKRNIFPIMCIWACFTAFYRDGAITVSPISAILMCVFFLIFGITAFVARSVRNKNS